jgi:hypothetical protein
MPPVPGPVPGLPAVGEPLLETLPVQAGKRSRPATANPHPKAGNRPITPYFIEVLREASKTAGDDCAGANKEAWRPPNCSILFSYIAGGKFQTSNARLASRCRGRDAGR